MRYRKLNIDPEFVRCARRELKENGIPFETAGDGRLMAPISPDREQAVTEAAKGAFWKDRDKGNGFRELPVISGHEKDLRYELAMREIAFAVMDDGRFVVKAGAISRELWFALTDDGIFPGNICEWDETRFGSDGPWPAEKGQCATTESLWPYVERILRRDGVGFRISGEDDALVPGDTFLVILQNGVHGLHVKTLRVFSVDYYEKSGGLLHTVHGVRLADRAIGFFARDLHARRPPGVKIDRAGVPGGAPALSMIRHAMETVLRFVFFPLTKGRRERYH